MKRFNHHEGKYINMKYNAKDSHNNKNRYKDRAQLKSMYALRQTFVYMNHLELVIILI